MQAGEEQGSGSSQTSSQRGRLKIFLGYAAGVGKSFRMFDEGRRRKDRGQDVVVAAVQSTVPDDVAPIMANFEVIPVIESASDVAINVPAILARHPQVALVDALANDNPAGSPHEHRWEDVRDLLDAGVSVITSLNLHHIAERRDQVEQITGKRGKYVVPESFVQTADEIEIVDMPPEQILERTGGRKGPEADAERHRLAELREMALLVTADVVDAQLDRYLRTHGVEETWGTEERLLVCLTPKSNAQMMISAARRNAFRFHGELIACHVRQPGISAAEQSRVDAALDMARQAGARVEVLDGKDPVETVLTFARRERVTQMFVGHSMDDGWRNRLFGAHLDRLIRGAENIDVRIFPH
jgi:two-component system sensor histidine kinase KdpD